MAIGQQPCIDIVTRVVVVCSNSGGDISSDIDHLASKISVLLTFIL